MIQLLLLSPPIVDKMLRDAKFHQFSFLKKPARTADTTHILQLKAGCGGCGRKRKRKTTAVKQVIRGSTDYNAIKRAIAHLNKDDQVIIKKLLGCRQLKIRYADRRGQTQVKLI